MSRQAPFLKKFNSQESAENFVKENKSSFNSLWSYCIAGLWWCEGWYDFD